MKLISDLKQGDKIYDIDFIKIKWYTYFCVHPRNDKYHILIDACEQPIRIYGEKLQNILNQDFKTYEEAKLKLVNRLEETINRLKTTK